MGSEPIARLAAISLLLAACGSTGSEASLSESSNGSSGATQSGAGSSALLGAGGSESVLANGSGGIASAPNTVNEDTIAFEVETTEIIEGDCKRELSLAAVVLEEPPPFDLIVVADHSDSLAWSRDDLSSGLASLLSSVQGRAVRVFLLTPTQYGASSAIGFHPLTGDPLVPWQDPATGEAYSNEMTSYTQVCTRTSDGQVMDCPDPSEKVGFFLDGEWTFEMPEPVAVLTEEMTDAEFTQQQQAVVDAILAIGGSGAPQEQPLCTLSRYVSQAASALPENAVFLILSDEDDVSTPEECLVSFSGELRVTLAENGTTACTSNCDAFRYSITGETHWIRYPYTCMAEDDLGNPFPDTSMSSWYNTGGVDSCDGFVSEPCDAELRSKVSDFCDVGLELQTCDSECATRSNVCRVDLPNASVNPCTSAFTYEGTTYANLEHYCSDRGSGWGACTGAGVNFQVVERYSAYFTPEGITEGTTTADLMAYFTSTASAAFATGRYLLEAIVFDEAFACEPQTGQSHATNIAQLVGDASRVFPICEPYAPALDGIWDFAQDLITTEFVIELESDEHVESVRLVDESGQERTLDPNDYSYERTTQTLRVEREALGAQDASLRVEVLSDCRPIIE